MWVPHHSYRCCIKALKFLHFSPFIFMRCIDAWKPFIPFYVFFLNTRASHQNVVFFLSFGEQQYFEDLRIMSPKITKLLNGFLKQCHKQKLRMKHLKQTLLNMFKEKIAFQACKSVLCALWCFIKRSSRAKINNCRNLIKKKERWDLKLRLFFASFFLTDCPADFWRHGCFA